MYWVIEGEFWKLRRKSQKIQQPVYPDGKEHVQKVLTEGHLMEGFFF